MLSTSVFGVLIFIALTVDAEKPTMDMCMTILNLETPSLLCCEGLDVLGEHEECDTKSSESSTSDEKWPCEAPECTMKKLSLLNIDGTVDEKAVANMLDEYIKGRPEQKAPATRIKEKCLGGKYMLYAPKETCNPIKFYMCGYLQTLLECPNWQDSQECKNLKNLTLACKEMMGAALDQLSQ